MPRWLEHAGYGLVIAFVALFCWKCTCSPWVAVFPLAIGLSMVRVFLTDAWENGL